MKTNPAEKQPMATPEVERKKTATSIFSVSLGVAGMRDVTADMVSGGMYAVHVKTSSARFALLASSLQSALATGLPCTIITGSAPEDVLMRIEQCAGFSVNEIIESNQLSVFSSQDEFSKNMFRYGAERLLRELESAGIPQRSFLIFDQADELLSLHDLFLASRQIKVIAAWLQSRQVTALITFCRSNEQRIEALNALLDDLSGLARLGGDKDGIELTFTYWQSSIDVIAARNFRLYVEAQGNYAVSRRSSERAVPIEKIGESQEVVLQPMLGLADLSFPDPVANSPVSAKTVSRGDLTRYVYTDPDLDVLKSSIDGHLHKVESLIDVLHACLGQAKSVIILSIENRTDIKELAKTTHLLRKSLGPPSQIIIREKDVTITTEQKQLFTNCGANAIISQGTEISHYATFLNAIRNQVYSKEIEPNFETIFARMPLSAHVLAMPTARASESPVTPSKRSNSFNYKPSQSGQQVANPTAKKAIEKAKRSSISALN